eukprot:1145336-Pelagomonas_calceolata.AAC.1
MDVKNWSLPSFYWNKYYRYCARTICAANVHGDKACPKRAFADRLKEYSASNIVALPYLTWWNIYIQKECEGHYLDSHEGAIIWLPTEGTLSAGGHFKAHCVLLIEEGAGELEHSDVLAWVQAASSKASQVVYIEWPGVWQRQLRICYLQFQRKI